MLSRAELLKMREMTFEDIDPKEIQDVEKLKIDVKKSKPEKVREILESGKNPYFLKYKGITIKIGFASTNRTIEEAMQSLVHIQTIGCRILLCRLYGLFHDLYTNDFRSHRC